MSEKENQQKAVTAYLTAFLAANKIDGFAYHVGDIIHSSEDGATWDTDEYSIVNFDHWEKQFIGWAPFRVLPSNGPHCRSFTLETNPKGFLVRDAPKWRCVPGKK